MRNKYLVWALTAVGILVVIAFAVPSVWNKIKGLFGSRTAATIPPSTVPIGTAGSPPIVAPAPSGPLADIAAGAKNIGQAVNTGVQVYNDISGVLGGGRTLTFDPSGNVIN